MMNWSLRGKGTSQKSNICQVSSTPMRDHLIPEILDFSLHHTVQKGYLFPIQRNAIKMSRVLEVLGIE